MGTSSDPKPSTSYLRRSGVKNAKRKNRSCSSRGKTLSLIVNSFWTRSNSSTEPQKSYKVRETMKRNQPKIPKLVAKIRRKTAKIPLKIPLKISLKMRRTMFPMPSRRKRRKSRRGRGGGGGGGVEVTKEEY